MKGTLLLIGGGEIGNGETRPIDEKVVSLSNKDNPHLLFLPTASHDERSYSQAVSVAYGALGCVVAPLYLLERTTPAHLLAVLNWADIIYIGGGDTKVMMEVFKATGFDRLLIDQLENRADLVVAGLSAGASMWCEKSYADYEITEGISDHMVFLSCLGYLPIVFNPHAQDPERANFINELKTVDFNEAYALDNDTVLIVKDKKVDSVFKAYPDKKVQRYLHKNGRIYSKTF